MGSVQRNPPFSSVGLSEGTQRGSVFTVHETGAAGPPKPRLLDRVRAAVRIRHYSRRTEEAYVAWTRRYILFHGKRHPVEMGAPELTRFLSSLAVLRPLEGVPRLMAHLLYGAGLRLLECCRLRVQDVDFATNQIVVRTGKGDKDRVTMLPEVVKADLARHLERSMR